MSESVIRLVGLVLFFAFAMLCCWRGNMTIFAMVRDINRAAPDEPESAYVWHSSKAHRVFKRYRALYPNGGLAKKAWFYTILMFVGAFGCWVLMLAD